MDLSRPIIATLSKMAGSLGSEDKVGYGGEKIAFVVGDVLVPLGGLVVFREHKISHNIEEIVQRGEVRPGAGEGLHPVEKLQQRVVLRDDAEVVVRETVLRVTISQLVKLMFGDGDPVLTVVEGLQRCGVSC